MRNPALKTILTVPVFLAISAGLFFHIMAAPINYNEQVYVPVSVLFQHLHMYRDFAFLQMPYLPMIYGAFYRLTGDTWYMLTGRAFTVFFTLASGILIFFISRRVTGNYWSSVLLAALLCINDVMLVPMKEASNYLMPTAFSLAGYYLFLVSLDKREPNGWGIFLSGLLVSAAVGARLFYAPLVLAFLGTGIIFPQGWPVAARAKKILLPFAAGALLGQTPTLYYLISDSRLFIFENFKYHLLSAEYHRGLANATRMSLPSKLGYALQVLYLFPANSVWLAACLMLGGLAAFAKRPWQAGSRKVSAGFVLALAGMIILAGCVFIPSPLWIQYFAMPLPFLFICVAFACKNIYPRWRHAVNALLLATAVATMLIDAPKFYDLAQNLSGADDLTGVGVHHEGARLRQAMEGHPGKVATIFPVLPLEAGLKIYPEFATATFLYEMGHLIPEPDRRGLVFCPSTELVEFLDKEPPAAILVSDTPFDILFLRYARQRGYRKTHEPFKGFTLYLPE